MENQWFNKQLEFELSVNRYYLKKNTPNFIIVTN